MSRRSIARRQFLRTTGALATGLPFYRSLERSAAGATSYPLRLLTVFTPHGTWLPFWRPQGGENDFTLQFENSMLAALEPYKKKLLVIDGLDHRIAYESGGTGHGAGAVVPFTGAPPIPNSADTTGPSIDQYLADRLGGTTPLRSLRLGVGSSSSFSFNASGKHLPSENRPADAYKLVFGAGLPMMTDTDAARRDLQKRLGVFAALKSQIDALKMRPRLGMAEQLKLDEHMSALADMEKRVSAMSTSGMGCQQPAAPSAQANANDPRIIPDVSRAQIDLLAQTFACDLTRFAGLTYHGQGSEAPMPYAGVNLNCHLDVAHQVSDANTGANMNLLKIHQWYAGEFAYLLKKLDSIAEGDGTLLDHTMIVWSNELGNPAVHDHFNVPFVVAGGTNGRFKMGRYVKLNTTGGYDCGVIQPPVPGCSASSKFAHLDAHNRLLVTVCQAFDQNIDFFNAPAYTGVVPGILA